MDAQLPRGPSDVTERQLEVARLVAEGRTNPEIATDLGITLDGAKYHVSELLGRLNLQRREEIALWYRAHRGSPLSRARKRLRAAFGLPLVALTTAGGAGVGVAVVLVAFAVLQASDDPADIGRVIDTAHGRWEMLEPPPEPLFHHFAVALDERHVLLGGGQEVRSGPGSENLSTGPQIRTWILDLDTGSYEELVEFTDLWGLVGAVRRHDGSVLIAGGVESTTEPGGWRALDGQLLEWSPATRSFAVIEDDQLGRIVAIGADTHGVPLVLNQDSHTFTLLREREPGSFEEIASVDLEMSQNTSASIFGDVAIATMADVAVIDSDTGEIVHLPGVMTSRTVLTTPVALGDGRVLLSGGFEANDWTAWTEAGMRDPALTVASGNPAGDIVGTDETFLVDAQAPSIEPSTPLAGGGRVNHVAVPLPDGRVLIAGGLAEYGGAAWQPEPVGVVLHDPANATSILLDDAPDVGRFPRATLLPDGSVLFTGTDPVASDPNEAKGLAIRFFPAAYP